ncbi:MAG: dTDP-4-dehydrorhamnose reductase [Dehalococcoidia bacterium]
MRVLLIGASGQLGTDIRRRWSRHEVVAVEHAALELANREQVEQTLAQIRPDAVINTAAFHQVERCEEVPERAFAINTVAVRGLARACAELGAVLMHFSTDYVFDGAAGRPYSEDDLPSPLNVYGCSKLAGEHLVRAACPRHYIVRTSGLFGVAGPSGKGLNFVQRILQRAHETGQVEVVTDQTLAQTSTWDLAGCLENLLEMERFGTYHITNAGGRSWFDFARLCLATAGVKAEVTPISSNQYGTHIRRPAYSVLENRQLIRAGLRTLRPVEEALGDYLASPPPADKKR